MIVCEHDVKGGKSLSCASGVIIILSAFYGRTDSTTCPGHIITNTSCVSDMSVFLQNTCNYQHSCFIPVAAFNTDPCFGTYKYLNVTFECSNALS